MADSLNTRCEGRDARGQCTKITSHQSGYCNDCRKKKCAFCGKNFVVIQALDVNRKLCSQCIRSECRVAAVAAGTV